MARQCFEYQSSIKAYVCCICRRSVRRQQCAVEPGKHKQWTRASAAAAIKRGPDCQQTGAQVASFDPTQLRKPNIEFCTCGVVGNRLLGHALDENRKVG